MPAPSAIENSIQEVLKLRHAGHLTAALMLAWATLEAVGRALLPEQLARPQPAGRLIEVLASEGLLTSSEADGLRRAVDVRNAATHGHLEQPVTAQQVDELIAALQLLAAMLAGGPSHAINPIELNRFAVEKEVNTIFPIDLRTLSTHTSVTIALAWFIADVWMDQPALQHSFPHKSRFFQYPG